MVLVDVTLEFADVNFNYMAIYYNVEEITGFVVQHLELTPFSRFKTANIICKTNIALNGTSSTRELHQVCVDSNSALGNIER